MTPSRPAALSLVLAALFTFSFGVAQGRGQAHASQRLVGRVIGVSDGDTLTVLLSGRPVKIRVEGVDCPERGQAFGRVAKNFTSQHVFGRTVELQPRESDRYGRLVSRVRAGEEDLGLALLSAGLAWHYTHYSNDQAYARAEQAARARHVGLWSQKDPVPPWVERRPHNVAPPAPAVPASQAPRVSGGPLHGNVKSRVFHAPGCPAYNCKQCTAVFASREDAVAHGFRPAGDCFSR